MVDLGGIAVSDVFVRVVYIFTDGFPALLIQPLTDVSPRRAAAIARYYVHRVARIVRAADGAMLAGTQRFNSKLKPCVAKLIEIFEDVGIYRHRAALPARLAAIAWRTHGWVIFGEYLVNIQPCMVISVITICTQANIFIVFNLIRNARIGCRRGCVSPGF